MDDRLVALHSARISCNDFVKAGVIVFVFMGTIADIRVGSMGRVVYEDVNGYDSGHSDSRR